MEDLKRWPGGRGRMARRGRSVSGRGLWFVRLEESVAWGEGMKFCPRKMNRMIVSAIEGDGMELGSGERDLRWRRELTALKRCRGTLIHWLINTFINSLIHYGYLYSTYSIHYYSEALPAQSRPKNFGLLGDVKFGRAGHQQGTQLNGDISFHADGPTSSKEKAIRCTVAKWAWGTKSSPLAAKRSTRRSSKTDTGQQRSQRQREGAAKDTERLSQ